MSTVKKWGVIRINEDGSSEFCKLDETFGTQDENEAKKWDNKCDTNSFIQQLPEGQYQVKNFFIEE